MPAMGVVQVSGDQIIEVIAVRDRFVATMGAVRVTGFMPLAGVARGTVIRVRAADLNRVLIVVVIMMMVQVPIMQVIDMIFVLYRSVPASRSVDVDMAASGVHLVRHRQYLVPFFLL